MDVIIDKCPFYQIPEMRFTDADKDWCDHPLLDYEESMYVVKDVDYIKREIPELCPLKFEEVTFKL